MMVMIMFNSDVFETSREKTFPFLNEFFLFRAAYSNTLQSTLS